MNPKERKLKKIKTNYKKRRSLKMNPIKTNLFKIK